MRHHHRTPAWSRYDIGERERAALAEQVLALVARLGFDITGASIRGVGMKDSGDALAIDLEGDDLMTGRAGRHYIEYPMERRETADDPVALKPSAADRLLGFLHQQRWRQERLRAIGGLGPRALAAHQDGDTFTRWARAMKRHDASRITELTTVPMQFREFDHECRATMRTAAGKVRLEKDEITLPMVIPDTFHGLSVRRLGALIEFPSCGDAELDAEMADTLIHEFETVPASTMRAAYTRITTFNQPQRPLASGADSAWRRLRSVRPIVMNLEPDYAVPDIEGSAAAYHAECDAALGKTTVLPVRLEVTTP